MRKFFIHIGTHKTGTTSIQHLLDSNRSALLQRGCFYPRTGRPTNLPGQHNFAWELSGDRRFRNEYGTIDELVREIKERSEDVILSSEDFECSLHCGSRFSEFISLLRSSGFLVTVILYVRNQVDYLPRIYLTLLHFGLKAPFAEVLAAVLDSGQIRWREWVLDFDYLDMLSRIGKSENVKIVVRSYEQSRMSLCNDFLSIFNLSLKDLQVDKEPFENVSLPLRDYLQLFLQNRIGRTLTAQEAESANQVVSSDATSIRLSPVTREKVFRRFSDTNHQLFIRYGILEPALKESETTETLFVDRLFSEDLVASVLKAR